jgi:hypothetical protein
LKSAQCRFANPPRNAAKRFYDEKHKKTTLATKNMSGLWFAFYLAQKVGKELGQR